MRENSPEVASLVVLDVNIYLDIAKVLGQGFTWADFTALSRVHAPGPLPHNDRCIDSVRAVATMMSGRFAGNQRLEIWTSDHIEDMVDYKLESVFGWDEPARDEFFDFMHDLVVERTAGGSIGNVQIAYGSPPLDHEDGLVYATVRDAGHAGTFYERTCVTADVPFCEAGLPGLIEVVQPHQWVHRVRAAHARAMRPRGASS